MTPITLVLYILLAVRIHKSRNRSKAGMRALAGFLCTFAVCAVVGMSLGSPYAAGSLAALLSPMVALVAAKLPKLAVARS